MMFLKSSILLAILGFGVVSNAGIIPGDSLEKAATKEVCYDDLGCFDRYEPFKDLPLPQSPDKVGVKFIYHVKGSAGESREVSASELKDLAGRSGDIHVVVHGWRTKATAWWVRPLVDATHKAYPDATVVVVDWSDGASNLDYVNPASNTRIVGRIVGNFLKSANVHSRTWCVGHSLGAHVCGYAGKWVVDHHKVAKFPRIFGLDPAGPNFDGKPSNARYAFTDALTTVAIHTSIWGHFTPIAQFDFYVNGGLSQTQAGCPILRGNPTETTTYDFLSCSHDRSIEYYTEGTKNIDSCAFSSCPCDYEKLVEGMCNMDCLSYEKANMVKRSYKTSHEGTYFTTTNKKPDYCKA